MATTDSILLSLRKILISEDDNSFDDELIMHINSALMICNQLGIGVEGFVVTGEQETWTEFLGETTAQFLQATKTYVHDVVRMIFDPPSNSFLVSAIEKRMKEYEWRLNAQVDPPAYNV